MTKQHEPLPVSGYTAQSDVKVRLVNANKETEESLLRCLDVMTGNEEINKRWLAIARTHFEQGFMAMNRAVFDPERISLPGDQE